MGGFEGMRGPFPSFPLPRRAGHPRAVPGTLEGCTGRGKALPREAEAAQALGKPLPCCRGLGGRREGSLSSKCSF